PIRILVVLDLGQVDLATEPGELLHVVVGVVPGPRQVLTLAADVVCARLDIEARTHLDATAQEERGPVEQAAGPHVIRVGACNREPLATGRDATRARGRPRLQSAHAS